MSRCICNFIPSLLRFEINKIIKKIIKHELDPEDLINQIINGIIKEEDYVDPDIDFLLKKNSLPFIYILNPFIINMQREDGLKLIDSVDDRKKVCAINDINFDDYIISKARFKFNNHPPTCYVIIGKPGLQEFELGEKIAEIYKCIHINVNQLVTNEIKSKTKLGAWLQLNLSLDRKIPVSIVLLMIQREVNLEIIQYRGYVLSGFPIVPDYQLKNDFKPFTYDTFKFFDLLINDVLQESINLAISSKFSKDVEEDEEEITVSSEKSINIEVNEEDTITDLAEKSSKGELNLLKELKNEAEVFLNEKDINDSIREQMVFLLNLNLRPTIVIYLECPDTDLLLMRTTKIKLCDPDAVQINIITDPVVSFYEAEGYEEAEKASEFEGENEEIIEVDEQISKAAIYKDAVIEVFEDSSNVGIQLKRYDEAVHYIQQFLLHYSVENVIEVDGRFALNVLVKTVINSLKFKSIKKVYFAIPCEIPDDPILNIENLKGLFPESGIQLLCATNTVVKNLNWWRSDFNTNCPVKLSQGKIIIGRPELSVRFLGYIYFLSSADDQQKFIENPYRYVNPLPNCRLAIIGPKNSGKSTLAMIMHKLLNANLINAHCRFQLIQEAVRQQYYQEGLSYALENETEKRKLQKQEDENQKIEIEKWKEDIHQMIARMKEFDPKNKDKNYKNIIEDTKKKLQDLNINYEENAPEIEFENILPENLKIEKRVYLPIDEKNTDVKKLTELFVEEKMKEHVISIENYVNSITERIKDFDNKALSSGNYGRFIIDDIPMELNFWEMLANERCLPDVVITIYDSKKIKIKEIYSAKHHRQFWDKEYVCQKVYETYSQLFSSSSCGKIIEPEMFSKEMIMRIIDLIIPYDKTAEVALLMDQLEECIDNQNQIEKFLESLGIIVLRVDIGKDNKVWSEFLIDAISQYLTLFKSKAYRLSIEECEALKNNAIELYREELQSKVVQPSKKKKKKLKWSMNVKNNETDEEETDHDEEAEEEEEEKPIEPIVIATPTDATSVSIAMKYYIPYGNTFNYCPVKFYENNILVSGNDTLVVSYNNYNYFLSSEENVDKFLQDPFKYSCSLKRPTPPKIHYSLIGPIGCHKKLICQNLAEKLNLKYYSFFKLVNSYLKSIKKLANAVLDNEKKIDDVTQTDEIETTDDAVVTEILKSQFIKYENRDEIVKELGNDVIIKNIICPLYGNENIVLEGYPQTIEELETMINNDIHPEMIIILKIDFDKIKDKAFNNIYNLYRMEMNTKLHDYYRAIELVKQNWEEQRSIEINNLFQFKKSANENQMEENQEKYQREDVVENEEEDMQKEDIDLCWCVDDDDELFNKAVDEVDKTFPQPVYPTDPTYNKEKIAELKAMINDKVNEIYINFMNNTTALKELATANKIPFTEVNIKKYEMKVILSKILKSCVATYRHLFIFDSIFKITNYDVITRLLEEGQYLYSRFGQMCPLDIMDKKCVNTFDYKLSKKKLTHLLYRDKLYHVSNFKFFEKNPWFYIASDKPMLSIYPVRISISGSQKSGVTTVCNRIARQYNLKVLNLFEIIEFIKKHLKWTSTYINIKRLNKKTHFIIDNQQLVWECLFTQKNFITNGFIMDDIIVNENFINLNQFNPNLQRLYFYEPNLIIFLLSDFLYIMKNLINFYFHDVDSIDNNSNNNNNNKYMESNNNKLIKKYSIEYLFKKYYRSWLHYNEKVELIRNNYNDNYKNFYCKNLHFLPITYNNYNNKWHLWYRIKLLIIKQMKRLSLYKKNLLAFDNNCCCWINTLIIDVIELNYRLDKSLLYCPICLIKFGKFTKVKYTTINVVNDEFYKNYIPSKRNNTITTTTDNNQYCISNLEDSNNLNELNTCLNCTMHDNETTNSNRDYCNNEESGINSDSYACGDNKKTGAAISTSLLYVTPKNLSKILYNKDYTDLYTNLIQYKDKFYWVCDKHIFDINVLSKDYLPVSVTKLPESYPYLVDSYNNDSIYQNGKCMVSYIDNLPETHIVNGDIELAIFYKKRIYLCANEDKALKFLQNPELYYNIEILKQSSLSTTTCDWDWENMKIDFKHLTNDLLIKLLIELVRERPKHIFHNRSITSAIYFGLLLKINNKMITDIQRSIYEEIFLQFNRECLLFEKHLNKFKTQSNPFYV